MLLDFFPAWSAKSENPGFTLKHFDHMHAQTPFQPGFLGFFEPRLAPAEFCTLTLHEESDAHKFAFFFSFRRPLLDSIYIAGV